MSQTWPVVVFTRTLGGLRSLWIRPRSCKWPSAVASSTATRRNCVISMGPWMSRSRGSPPGFSSTSIVWPLCRESASGRTAHDPSSAVLIEYSCSIRLRLSGAGRVEAGASSRTDGGVASWLGWRPRLRMNASSVRRGSRTYWESSTVTALLSARCGRPHAPPECNRVAETAPSCLGMRALIPEHQAKGSARQECLRRSFLPNDAFGVRVDIEVRAA